MVGGLRQGPGVGEHKEGLSREHPWRTEGVQERAPRSWEESSQPGEGSCEGRTAGAGPSEAPERDQEGMPTTGDAAGRPGPEGRRTRLGAVALERGWLGPSGGWVIAVWGLCLWGQNSGQNAKADVHRMGAT